MTVQNAIKIAKSAIKSTQEYYDRTKKYDDENPDTSSSQAGHRISKLVMQLLSWGIIVFELILAELELPCKKDDAKRKKKSL